MLWDVTYSEAMIHLTTGCPALSPPAGSRACKTCIKAVPVHFRCAVGAQHSKCCGILSVALGCCSLDVTSWAIWTLTLSCCPWYSENWDCGPVYNQHCLSHLHALHCLAQGNQIGMFCISGPSIGDNIVA